MAQGQGQATQVRLSRAAEAPYLEPEPWEYDPRYLTFDPQAPGLDDVDPVPTDEAVVARAALRRDLARTGLPSPVVEMLGKVVDVASPACATGATSAVESDLADAELVAVAQAARGLQAFADGVVSSVVRALAPRVGQVLLARAGVSSPGDLSHTARQRWRARVKSLIAHELSVATGWGIQSCHDRVGFALAPGSATAPAAQALQAGLTDWREVGQWWRSCRDLETDEAAQVARALFDPMADSRPGGGDGDSCNGGDGGDESADDDHSPSDGTASEPEDDGGLEPPDHAEPGSADDQEPWDDTRQPGALVPDQRWPSWSEYQRDLDREVARVRGADAQDARRRRKEALDRRGIRAVVFDDGTGELCVTGPATSVIAAAERLSTIAFKARQAGDARTRSQIESDTTLALLVHGTLPLPAEPCLPADGSTGDEAGSAEEPLAPAAAAMLADYQEQLAAIVTGMPNATVDLIVPFDMLLPAGGTSGGEAPGGASGSGASSGTSGGGADGGPHPPGPDNLLAFPARHGPQEEPPAGPDPPRGPVAEAVGYGFLTPEFVRELSLIHI